jgi:hypothetical protein
MVEGFGRPAAVLAAVAVTPEDGASGDWGGAAIWHLHIAGEANDRRNLDR